MAGWSKIADGSALDCFETLHKLQAKEFWYGLEPGLKGSVDCAKQDVLRCLFDQILCIFLKATCQSDCFLSLPPMLGDGKSVDLFKLYSVVRGKGGYEAISMNGLWNSVAEEFGLGSGVGSAVKLIYVKYLDALDRWLQRMVEDKDLNGGLQDSGADLGGGLMEIKPEFRGASSEGLGETKNGEYLHLYLEKSHLNSIEVEKLYNGNEVKRSAVSDEGRNNVEDTKNVCEGEVNMILDSRVCTEEVSNRKRKRECHQRLVDWVVEVAKNPCDLQIGSLPESSKWKCYGNQQLWKQVLLAREAMFLNRNVDVSADQSISNWLRKQRMHPSMFDDRIGSERARCSRRVPSGKDSRALAPKTRACSESSSGTQSDLENRFDKVSESCPADSVFNWLEDNHNRKRVPVGPFFQADVPEWNGNTYESDSRWLGSRVWPLENGGHNKSLIEGVHIGKGRQDSCGCQHPGVVECVKLHVAENRMRVKLELGLAFHYWKFNKMGEEVALSWTKEEEKKFQEIIRSNPPSLDKCFWDEIVKSFRGKKREELVSYYFNVFLLQRRGYQNRLTPSNLDSDDEESGFGSLTNGLRSPGSIFRSPKKAMLKFRSTSSQRPFET